MGLGIVLPSCLAAVLLIFCTGAGAEDLDSPPTPAADEPAGLDAIETIAAYADGRGERHLVRRDAQGRIWINYRNDSSNSGIFLDRSKQILRLSTTGLPNDSVVYRSAAEFLRAGLEDDRYAPALFLQQQARTFDEGMLMALDDLARQDASLDSGETAAVLAALRLDFDYPTAAPTNQVIGAIQRSRQSLPADAANWRARRLFALSPLARLDLAPEMKRLRFNQAYIRQVRDYFEAYTAPGGPPRTDASVELGMLAALGLEYFYEPAIEPLAEFYLRTAKLYRHLRGTLAVVLGRDTLRTLHRPTADGTMRPSLWDELHGMAKLFEGAYLLACYDIGLSPQPIEDSGAARQAIEDWRAAMAANPDLRADVRVMIPTAYNHGVYHVKALLGLLPTTLNYEYGRKPDYEVPDAPGGNKGADKTFAYYQDHPYTFHQNLLTGVAESISSPRAPYLLAIEGEVADLLDRAEFQKRLDAAPDLPSALRAIGLPTNGINEQCKYGNVSDK